MNAENQLTALLQAASDSNINVRAPAEAQLQLLQETNFSHYIQSLCNELGNEQKPLLVRQLAGLMLKNALSAKSEQHVLVLAQRWLALPDQIRTPIKHSLLSILSSQHRQIRSTAALVLAKVGGIEIPSKQFLDLVPTLVQNITNQSNPGLRAASFESLGYVCEEVPDSLQDSSNLILNAIATGMRVDEQDNEIKYASTNALANSVDFVKSNFANAQERGLIIQMIFNVIPCSDVRVRKAAYVCLVQIATNYYEYLADFIGRIFDVTSVAIIKEETEVSLQAIEFWSALAEEEVAQNEDAFDDEEQPGELKNKNFVLQALPRLVPLLLQCMTQQTSEELDEDEWDRPQAASTCLGLCADAAGDEIVPLVLPFVEQNIQNGDWHLREAATLSFGAILVGPSAQKLAPLVSQALPMLLQLLNDPSPLVKDSAAWTIGRVCSIVPETINPTVLPHLMQALFKGLADTSNIAAHACWAIYNLASNLEPDEGNETNQLSPYFGELMKALFTVSNRTDVNKDNLQTGTYEAINELINTAAKDSYPIVQQLVPELLNRLNSTLTVSSLATDARERLNEVQALLCGSLQTIIQKLDPAMSSQIADETMTLLLRVLDNKHSGVVEEALMAIGAVANKTGSGFVKYISHLQPFLFVALRNSADYKVCTVAVGLVGDITRALENKFVPLGDDVMKILLEHLQTPTMDRSVKPHIISAMGDIAMAVGGYFERYLSYVVQMLVQASQTRFEESDYDTVDYLLQLRESVSEAYTGIVYGLSNDGKQNLLLQFTNNGAAFVDFFDLLSKDEHTNSSETLLRSAVGLIGDLARLLGSPLKQALKTASVMKLLETASKFHDDSALVELSRYASEQIH